MLFVVVNSLLQKHICTFFLHLEVKKTIPSHNWAIALYIDQLTLSNVTHIAWSLSLDIKFCFVARWWLSLAYPGYYRRANFFCISLQNLASRACTREAISGQGEKEQAVSKRCFQLLARAVGSTFFYWYKRPPKVIRLVTCFRILFSSQMNCKRSYPWLRLTSKARNNWNETRTATHTAITHLSNLIHGIYQER